MHCKGHLPSGQTDNYNFTSVDSSYKNRRRYGLLRMRSLFRLFPFLRLYLAIACLLITAHSFLYLWNAPTHRNVNRMAASIRDQETLRTAYALTKISEWRNFQGIKTFQYKRSPAAGGTGPKPDAPGVTFAILSADRRSHRIDAYETFYLTETLTLTMESIYHDRDVHDQRFAFVNISVCPTTDNLTVFSELNDVSDLLPHGSVKPRLKPCDSQSIECRTLLDVASCLLQSSASGPGYTVLLEDDMMPEPRMMNQLWRLLAQLQTAGSHSSIGAVQLHTPPDQVLYRLSDGQSMLELLLLSSLTAFLLFIVWLRIWYRPFMLPYNLVLVCSTLLLSALLVTLIDRISWLKFWHRVLGIQGFSPSANPEAAATGAAVLFPARVARQLAETIWAHGCAEISPNGRGSDMAEGSLPFLGRKASVINELLGSKGYRVWSSFPSLFKHRGLYSMYLADVNPMAVE